jgi:hypothetical protein
LLSPTRTRGSSGLCFKLASHTALLSEDPPRVCETTEKCAAQIGPARNEPDFYRGHRGLPAIEACTSGFPIWAPRSIG